MVTLVTNTRRSLGMCLGIINCFAIVVIFVTVPATGVVPPVAVNVIDVEEGIDRTR